jgi:hypothetical protein
MKDIPEVKEDWVEPTLTPEQEALYMTRLGTRCPVCKTTRIEHVYPAWHPDQHRHLLTREGRCGECETIWHDTYTLSSIELIPEEDSGWGGDGG